MGIASLTLGITGLVAWLDPFLGIPICIAGVILGVLALVKSEQYRKQATFGLGFSLTGLVASVIWAVVGVMAFLGLMMEVFESGGYGGF